MYIVEVQHSSDFNLDGKWFEIDSGDSVEWAEKTLKDFGERPKLVGSQRDCGDYDYPSVLSGSYAGRPLRYRKVDATN
jgi:hypothetical protein